MSKQVQIPLLSQVSFLGTAAALPSWCQYHRYSNLPLMNCVFDILVTHLFRLHFCDVSLRPFIVNMCKRQEQY